MTPVPGAAGISFTVVAPKRPMTMCGIVLACIWKAFILRRPSFWAFSIAWGTWFDFA